MKIYNLSNDYLFKKIFSKEKYLKKLLLDLFDVNVENLEYLNTELIKTNKYSKVGIVDMLLKVNGEIVILELQNINRHNFKERLLFYSSNIISNYGLKEGEDYNKLRKIKVYAIINYRLFAGEFKSKINLKRNNEIFTEKLEYQIFDLTKIKDKDYEIISLFKKNKYEELEEIIKDKQNIEILEEIKNYNLEKEEKNKMDDIAKMMMEEKEHYETAYYVGREEGMNDGISEGLSKGIIQTAKNMLEEDVDINLISKYTNLSINEIKALKENN